MEIREFAEIILKAQEIRVKGYISSTNGFTKTHLQAAQEACGEEKEFAYAVSILNNFAWNEIKMWAENILVPVVTQKFINVFMDGCGHAYDTREKSEQSKKTKNWIGLLVHTYHDGQFFSVELETE